MSVESIPVHRGIIYDRNHEPLAVSTPVYSFWLDPTRTHLSQEEIKDIANLLPNVSVSGLTNKLVNSKSKYVLIRKYLTPFVVAQIKALDIRGLSFDRAYKRYYPAGETVAHVIGMTGNNSGMEGVELQFENTLKGLEGSKRVLKDRLGQTVKVLEHIKRPRSGNDVVLSVDLRLQFFAYRELKSAVDQSGAESGSLVMLDVESGRVLALVNQPSYNPNDRSRFEYSNVRNRTITDVYEPGSTVKPLAMVAALTSGKFDVNSKIDTSPGHLRIGTKLIPDPSNYGVLSVGQVLAKSSQVGISKIALKLDDRAVYDVYSRVGFGQQTGIELPGERSGSLTDRNIRSPLVRATLAYGYGLTVTPLQLAQAYLTLANGGIRKSVSILQSDQVIQGTRVFDETAVLNVTRMLREVATEKGTAPQARVAGYDIAGKTGTARMLNKSGGGYDDTRHVTFFAGMAPAVDPKIVVVVIVSDPHSKTVGGGSVAAPIFSRVVARALRILSVSPPVEAA
ncbi:MAG: penicillin-binding protein 2 [Pseudomonadales bacterium]|nr:penicillin-binding protein 2 [Pseudomonadales bacterium]